MVKPNCGKCGKTMTPQNSTAAPEYFLCDDCAVAVGLMPRRSQQAIAEVPPELADADKWALRLISFSRPEDFGNDHEWAVWCRACAGAGLAKDDKQLERLERKLTNGAGGIREMFRQANH